MEADPTNRLSTRVSQDQKKALELIRRILSSEKDDGKQARNELCNHLLPLACGLADRWLGPQTGGLAPWLDHQVGKLDHGGPDILGAIHDGLLRATDPKNLLRYDPGRPFVAWAMTIVKNCIIDTLRSAQRRSQREALLQQQLTSGWVVDPLEELHRSEKIERTGRILKSMPPRSAAILLHKHAGFTFRELGEELGISEDAAESRYRRAALKFKRLWEEEIRKGGIHYAGTGG